MMPKIELVAWHPHKPVKLLKNPWWYQFCPPSGFPSTPGFTPLLFGQSRSTFNSSQYNYELIFVDFSPISPAKFPWRTPYAIISSLF